MSRLLLLFLAVAFLPHALAQPRTAAQRLHALAEQMVEREHDLAPIDEVYALGTGPRAARAFVDLTPGWQERKRKLYRDVLERLRQVPRSELAPADRIHHDLLRYHAEKQLARAEVPMAEVALLNPGWGLLPRLVTLATGTQPLRTASDFEAWLQRIEASAATFDHAIAALRTAASKGWTTPRPLAEKALRQIEAFTKAEAQQTPFWAVVGRYPADAPAAERSRYAARYQAAIEKRLLPALARLADFLREEYLPKARETAGIGALPGGERAYRALVREYTTLDLPPDEIHALGLREVERVRGKLLETARSLGFRGEIRDFAPWLQSNRANYPFRSGEEVIAHLRRIHARVEPQLPKLFKRLPKAGFDIQLVDPTIAGSASASYSRPLADGSRPGVFRIPVRDAPTQPAHGLTALLLHEGMPGHHLDIGRGIELDLPRFRKLRSLTVYSEGWGLYAESLGHELGVYDDPWALLGRYAAELGRAARLVVDTGLHAKGWSREQTIRYLVDECGSTEVGAIVATERYMGAPGQALAYKIGELEILRLREEARAALGERFDLREFHEVILAEGQVTLPMLRERVKGWIARQK